jgi:signal transduction histidine kinase
VVILFWLINFYKNNLNSHIYLRLSKQTLTIIAYIQIVILGAICFLFAGIIKSLVLDSKISFDVANFFSLNIYTIISFSILCLLTLSFFSIAQLLLARVYHQKIPLNIQLFIISVEGLLYASIQIGGSSTITNIAVLAWLLCFLTIFYYRKQDIIRSLYHTTFFIFWVMFFASSVAAMVIYQNKVVELEQRKRIAEKLASQADPSGENLLNIAMTNFDDHFLTQNFDRLDSDFTNKFLKDSLISSNFSGYLNKYETHIYTFDSLFHPLFNDDTTNYATIRTIVLRRAKPTSIPGLYTYTTNGNRLGYLFEKDIKSTEEHILGYFFVIVIPKKFASEALYPELFTQIDDFSNELNGNYAYAVYNNGKMVSSYNDYSFPILVNKQLSSLAQFTVINKNGYNELWYNAENGRQVLIVRKNEWILESLTLFAYLFCSFLLLIFLLHTVQFLLLKRFRWKEIKSSFVFDIRSQINLTIISISLFSFIVIGAATISFFINRFNKNKEDKLFKSVQLIGNEIQNKINAELLFDDAINVNDFTTGGIREKRIIDIAEMHNVDINYYDAAGNLKASTQPYIYNKHLLNNKMNPFAYYELHHLKKSRFEQDEQIGTLRFLSVYTPIVDEQGNTYAYLNIPYLNSQAELKQEISGFLATLINLNAFIFLVAGAIAFLITNRITASFSLIADKMKAISLGKKNEELTWKKQDEIGILIQEYNKMVHQLEESAEALAKSEREGAWREMARQVAHEIKNPLTPMKLSIQYLQKAVNDKQLDAAQLNSLTNRVTLTLIEQIDQLSKIAGDFSQFANIGNVQLEYFDISEVIRSLVQLHSADNNVKISWKKEMGFYGLYADKTQMQRLFTNLIKNAFEAVEGVTNPSVHIHQANVANNILISVTDNGSGIPDEFIGKIFSPNFTTKSSGTGLGLAICKGIVEKADGKIWFVTKQAIGTTFYVQLPFGSKTV